MIKVNGKEIGIRDVSVKELLEREGYTLSRIAVELNGEILLKSQYGTKLKDGDSIEVVSFVGGG